MSKVILLLALIAPTFGGIALPIQCSDYLHKCSRGLPIVSLIEGHLLKDGRIHFKTTFVEEHIAVYDADVLIVCPGIYFISFTAHTKSSSTTLWIQQAGKEKSELMTTPVGGGSGQTAVDLKCGSKIFIKTSGNDLALGNSAALVVYRLSEGPSTNVHA